MKDWLLLTAALTVAFTIGLTLAGFITMLLWVIKFG